MKLCNTSIDIAASKAFSISYSKVFEVNKVNSGLIFFPLPENTCLIGSTKRVGPD